MSNLHGRPDSVFELQSLSGDLLPAGILSTTWPTVPAPPSLTFAAFATRGYVKDGTTLIYVEQPAHTLGVGSSDGQYWLALARDTSTPVSGWTRQLGTHYLVTSGAGQPATPAGCLIFASALVSGGAITSVTPLPVVMGNPPAWRAHLGLGTMATQNASAVSITGGTARFDGRLEVGAAPLLVADPATNRVGVLKAVPTQALDVAGNVAVSQKLFVTQGIELGGAPGPNQALAIQYPKATLTGILLRPTDGDGGSFGAITFMNYAAGVVGTITTTATATAYNTSSDGRLKERLTPLTGALATLRQLLPVRFRWKTTGAPGVGFVAQDVAPVVPEAVTGTPEAPEPMGMDMSKLVPYLAAGINELMAKCEALEARLLAIEGPGGAP